MKSLRTKICGSCLTAFVTVATSHAYADDLRIAELQAAVAKPYFITMKCGAEAAAKDLGVKLLWAGTPSPEVAEERKIFDALKLQNPDGWLISTFSSTAFIQPVKELMAAGKPVVLADGSLDEDVMLEGFNSDSSDAAQQIAAYLTSHIKGKGKVGIIASFPGDVVDAGRYKGLPDAFAKSGSPLEVLPVQYGQVDSSLTAKIAAGLILAHSDLTAIYATNGSAAEGVVSAVRSAHAEDRVMVVAYDATPDEVEALHENRIQALLAQSPYLIGNESVKSVVKYLRANPNGGPVKPNTPIHKTTPIKLLTKDNIDSEEGMKFHEISVCK
ncbi:hypothetical protein EN943_36680 [Mesorhizobium sp. M7A.F.Ca.US.006.01.1.1]|uniref:substrate-binding domain-containing protein n=1 Tax=Mesorhizobium sp. M7A.F.Ca.US.006.01.1.1 TaxID=2496707 RepID=UPI000FCC6782|nr:substrate-binding domain-containing protein [Mesorhizobium sp. M7A.F.Ca.US.006.01.1.1]RUZ70025.1 hypothetical protein EN943_36680 [Mesorhizobium sp. M7A.F.Ca.US.006.01.1.1]